MQAQYQADWKRDIMPMLPQSIQSILQHVDDTEAVEEIRIRVNQPLQLCYGGHDRLLYAPGKKKAATMEDCKSIVAGFAEHSLYAWEEEIRNGFLSLPGGYRIGICGKAQNRNGHVSQITEFTSINIRVARDCVGCADELLPHLISPDGMVYPTLVISPPGCGKTTMLRDIARQLSQGNETRRGRRVCLVDERMELAGNIRGAPQFAVGPRTDVLYGCNKAEGISLAVRTLSPEILVTDEIGGRLDADAVQDAAFSGVCAIASAHVGDANSLRMRLPLMDLLCSGAFKRIALLGRRQGRAGALLGIYDSKLQPVEGMEKVVLCFDR